ncbi:alpha/beta hydrolase [Acidothermaceae bacterium B102]|nr:alpha/beta hydrolase [Acidothermaceae bacterium B102]
MSAGPLAVLTCTPPSPTDTAVLVPGYTGSKEDFLAILEPLAATGHSVLTYDQRGQFESPGDDEPTSYEIGALAGELLDLLRLVGPAHVVGHSFGGLVSRAAALRDPTAFLSLTLLCSGPAAVPGARADAVRTLRPVLAEGGKAALWQRMTELSEGGEPLPDDVAAFLQRRFDGSSGVGYLVMGDALITEADRTDELRTTGLPMLVAYGADDDAWPPALQADMARRLGVAAAVIAGAAHSPAVEQPDATVAVLHEFWTAVSREAGAR